MAISSSSITDQEEICRRIQGFIGNDPHRAIERVQQSREDAARHLIRALGVVQEYRQFLLDVFIISTTMAFQKFFIRTHGIEPFDIAFQQIQTKPGYHNADELRQTAYQIESDERIAIMLWAFGHIIRSRYPTTLEIKHAESIKD